MPDRAAFSAVLFDCDGVLVDSEPITNEVLRGMFAELGWHLTPEECVHLFLGRSLRDESRVIEEHAGYRIDDAWLGEFRRRRNEALRAGLTPIAGAADAVSGALELTGRVACVTGADRVKVELQLGITGLAPLFGEHVFSGMEQPRTKPAPDVYLAAAASLGIDPASAAVVEDSVAGVTAGMAAGATVFGYAPGGITSTDPERLVAAGATATFASMSELARLLTSGLTPVSSRAAR